MAKRFDSLIRIFLDNQQSTTNFYRHIVVHIARYKAQQDGLWLWQKHQLHPAPYEPVHQDVYQRLHAYKFFEDKSFTVTILWYAQNHPAQQ